MKIKNILLIILLIVSCKNIKAEVEPTSVTQIHIETIDINTSDTIIVEDTRVKPIVKKPSRRQVSETPMIITVPTEIEPKTDVFALKAHTGIDIGGAVPYPPAAVLGGGNKMFAIPKLFPSLGISFTFFLDKHWQLAAETTYKVVGMDAQSRLDLESIREVKEDGTESVQYFAGRADAQMSFSMLELPLYVKYAFKGGKHKILAGGYYAHIFKSTFHTSPIQGMAGSSEDQSTWEPFGPGDLPTQIFDDKLDTWDAGFLLGYEVEIIDRVDFGARLSVGLKDIFRSGVENKYLSYAMLHMRGTFMLSYTFLRE